MYTCIKHPRVPIIFEIANVCTLIRAGKKSCFFIIEEELEVLNQRKRKIPQRLQRITLESTEKRNELKRTSTFDDLQFGNHLDLSDIPTSTQELSSKKHPSCSLYVRSKSFSKFKEFENQLDLSDIPTTSSQRRRTVSEESDFIIFEKDSEDESTSDDESSTETETASDTVSSSSTDRSSDDEIFNFCRKRKVHFRLNPTVHTMCAWSYAYKSARKGHWEQHARDRMRFQQRIQRTGEALNPILGIAHRFRILEERFIKYREAMVEELV